LSVCLRLRRVVRRTQQIARRIVRIRRVDVRSSRAHPINTRPGQPAGALLILKGEPVLLVQFLADGQLKQVTKRRVYRACNIPTVAAVRAVANGDRYFQQEITAGALGRAGPDFLSYRERRALNLWAEGRTNAEVAGTLRLSLRTVESVRADLRRRLGLSSRSSIVQYARERI
jgi:DNA-binding CsgD family transcriptional regulator